MLFKKLLPIFFVMLSYGAKANYMLVQNVTKVGNNPTNKTIQIQFDLSWQNSWRDSINWDAAWIFIKFKDASGLWQHARLNLAGYVNGAGTINTIKVASDSVGAFVYRDVLGSGNFNATSMQLQWNYGASGLTDVSALEVRVFAVEMVYIPEGDFNCAKGYYNIYGHDFDSIVVSGGNNLVINNRISPPISFKSRTMGTETILRIKGDVGLDTNNDGIVDNFNYPTGYKSFYCYKYELTEQQYADFFNLLTPLQQSNIGLINATISQINGVYYSSTPTRACANANENRVLSYAEWSGVRPMTILEFNKASYGPLQPVENIIYSGRLCYPAWGDSYSLSYPDIYEMRYWHNNTNPIVAANVGSMADSSSSRSKSGASYYGVMDLTGNVIEPVVVISYFTFFSKNGSGLLPLTNNTYNTYNWTDNMLHFIDQAPEITNMLRDGSEPSTLQGFRYVRSAE